jgi:hypothetical protein
LECDADEQVSSHGRTNSAAAGHSSTKRWHTCSDFREEAIENQFKEEATADLFGTVSLFINLLTVVQNSVCLQHSEQTNSAISRQMNLVHYITNLPFNATILIGI